ncbi:MAG: TolC family protein [Muribaculaceae bacterium]|nr:TolC family protein [Muribaculaceae bacterium]
MNNHRLLAGLLAVALLGGGVCICAQSRRVMSIEDLFEAAESGSARLRQSLSVEAEAGQAVSVARSGRLPEINISLSASYIGDGFTTKRNFKDYQKAPIPHLGTGLSLNISQPVYTGGTITAGIELADLRSTAARYATELQRDNIRFRLTGYYLDLYKCANLRRVVERNIVLARKMLDEMRARYAQGVALQNDITRYELLVSNLELQRLKLDNTMAILNNDLVTTASLSGDTEIVPDSTILDRSLPSADETWWQQTAVADAPSLKLARSGVEINRKAEDIIRAERLPKIGIKAGWTMDGPILVEIPPINRNLSYWYVGVGVSYNLSSLYKTNKSLSRSRIATRHAEDEYLSALEDVRVGVRADYVRYLESYEELKSRLKGVELAERNYNVTSTRYSADMALITDMLDAANSLLDAQQQLVNARINIIYCYYKLLFITGKI